MYHKLRGDEKSVADIHKYLNFIKYCQQTGGNFLNYLDRDGNFTEQNSTTNLDDANGRAIWALGYLVSCKNSLPIEIISEASAIMEKALEHIANVHSTRAMAFTIKGLYYYQTVVKSAKNIDLIAAFANRLVQMYKHESSAEWTCKCGSPCYFVFQ